MKLHLPIALYRSLLAVILSLPVFCGSALAEVYMSPGRNGDTVVTVAEDYKMGTSNDYSTNYWWFELRAPESSTDNTVYLVGETTKAQQIKNGQLCWVSDTDSPVSLDISGIENGVFWYGNSVSSKTSARAFDARYLDNVTISGNKNNGGLTFSSKITGVLSVYEEKSRIVISDNYGDVTLSDNEISYYSSETRNNLYGAAISIQGLTSTLNLDNNQAVTITGNKACGNSDKKSAEGGAVYLYQKNTFSISGNEGLVTLAQNQVKQEKGYARGGAVALGSSSTMDIAGNTAGVLIHSNIAESQREAADTTNQAAGGAIFGSGGTVSLNITGNEGTASYNGQEAVVILADNAAINAGYGARGGAVSIVSAKINDNAGDVLIADNYASAGMAKSYTTGIAPIASAGGAFFVGHSQTSLSSALQISGNENVTISGNHADAAEGFAMGGAVYAELGRGIVDISGNTGKVQITGNYAAVTNGTAVGGAVYALGGIRIEGNDEVLLRGNYEQSGDTFRLRSLYYSTAYGSSEATNGTAGVTEFRLMAAAGKKIEIHDSVYSGRSGKNVQVVFNGSYTAADGTEVKGDGTIRFTGANTVADLKAAKWNAGIAEELITISDEEINNSRTSEFKTNIQLLGGRLEIADQAQIKGVGLTVENGATVQLHNGILNHAGSALSFGSGTTLELVGANTVAGNVEMASDSYLNIVFDSSLRSGAAMALTGSLDMAEGYSVQLSGFGDYKGKFKLFDMQEATASWTGITFRNEAGEALDSSLLMWVDNVLYYKKFAADLVWNNQGSEGKWNSATQNWMQDDTQAGTSHQENVYFGVNSGESVELEGSLDVANMTVQAGGSYVYTENESASASLSVRETFKVEAGASVDLQLSEGVQVNTRLESAGHLKAEKITGAGSVAVTGGSLELADDTDALAVEGEVSISNAELSGTWKASNLSVGGSTVVSGADITLCDATITSPLTTKGTLALQGKLDVQTGGLVLAGGRLELDTGLEKSQTGVISVQSASILSLDDGAEIFRGNIGGLSNDNTLTVEGKGKLNLGSSSDKTGYVLGQSWEGTVKLENIADSSSLRLTELGQEGSAIELENCAGHTGASEGEIKAHVELTKSDGAEVAFRVSDGFSVSNNAGFVMNTFSGNVSGEGKMVIDQAGSGSYTGFKFTGDVSAWKGAFEMNAKNTFNLVFSGDADEIVNDIKNTSTEGTLILKLQSGNDMSLSGNITTDSIEISNTSKVAFSGNVDTDSLKVSSAAELVFGGESSSSTISSLTSKDDIQLTKNGNGTLQISGGASAISSLEVNGGILEMAGYVDSSKSINSNITVNSGAELRFSDTVADILNYGATGKSITVNGGTVDFGTTRQSMGTWAITLKNGATLKGEGMLYTSAHKDSAGVAHNSQYAAAIDIHNNTVITVESGLNSIESNIRLRKQSNAKLTFNVTDEKASVDVSGHIHYDDEGQAAGTIVKEGKGSLSLSSPVLLDSINHKEGTISLVDDSVVNTFCVEEKGGTLQLSGDVQIGTLQAKAGTLSLASTDKVVKQIGTLDCSMTGGTEANGTLRLEKDTKLKVQQEIWGNSNAGSAIELAKDAELEHKGFVFTNTTDETAVLRATADGEQYSNEKTEYSLTDGYVKVLADAGEYSNTGAVLMRNQLVNTAVENAGDTLLKVRNTGNSLVGVHATTASIGLFEQEKHELKDLSVKAGLTVSAYTDVNGAAENLATLFVDGTAGFGSGITLNANLVMEQGAVVTMADTVKLEGTLTLQAGLELAGDVLNKIANLKEGESCILFTQVDGLYLQNLEQTVTLYNMRTLAEETEDLVNYSPLMNDTEVAAGDYFSSLAGNSNLVLSYNSTDGTVSITNNTQAIPEPTAATLSLLALAGLAMRRRRK